MSEVGIPVKDITYLINWMVGLLKVAALSTEYIKEKELTEDFAKWLKDKNLAE